MVVPQPRRLVREQRERGRVRLREAEAGEARDLVVDLVRERLVEALAHRALRRTAPGTPRSRPRCVCAKARVASPSASPIENPATAIATSSTWSWKMIVPSVSRSGSSSSGCSTGGTYDGSSRSAWRRSMNGCTDFDWIGPGRMIATWIVRSSRFSGRVRSSVCICARDSIWNVPTVSAFWISAYTSGSCNGMRERSIVSAVHARDLLDAVLDRREHPEPEQVDLQEARVGARVLVPLHHLPAGHRARLHGDELDERP